MEGVLDQQNGASSSHSRRATISAEDETKDVHPVPVRRSLHLAGGLLEVSDEYFE